MTFSAEVRERALRLVLEQPASPNQGLRYPVCVKLIGAPTLTLWRQARIFDHCDIAASRK